MTEQNADLTPKMDYLHTIDVAVLRLNRQSRVIEILLHKRPNEPFAEQWALPGIVLNGSQRDASMQDGVERLISSTKVGFIQAYIEQVGTVGDAVRDPRCWSSSTFYLALVANDVALSDRQKFVPLSEVLSREVVLPFDHNDLVDQVHDRLSSKSLYSNLPLLFLGKEFSAPEATAIYSIVLGREVQKTSIRQRLEKLIEEQYILESGRKKSSELVAKSSATMLQMRPGEIFYFDRSFAYA